MTKPLSTTALVAAIKTEKQDFEWYPTTKNMLKLIRLHIIRKHKDTYRDEEPSVSVLDCGAGDGRALTALAGEHGDKYAIEKSTILIGQQPNEIIPVGTDFHAATLIDKNVQVVFSNPPYSEYEQWATRIIREANAADIYLVIPQRWTNSDNIKAALESRKAKTTVIDSDDFLSADRAARAKVDILHIDLKANSKSYYSRDRETPDTDPFELWFAEAFPKAPQPEKDNTVKSKGDRLKDKVENEMVTGKNLIEALVQLYNKEMQHLQKNYSAAMALDPTLLNEMGVQYDALESAIKSKIKGLKNLYWNEFFNNYESITDRLTESSRKSILSTLQDNTAVEFTEDNAYAITIWVIKNANSYYDGQLVDLVEKMVNQASVSLYKSNQRTFGAEDWRHSQYSWCSRQKTPDTLTHFKLEYRIVLDRVGGISNSSYSWENSQYAGLTERASHFINDIIAVAKTLGWSIDETATHTGAWKREWASNKKQTFTSNSGEHLMEVRAFKNGNLHIKFSQKLMKKLNVEFGRLKGWLKDHQQAAEELKIKPEEAAECFGSTLQITAASSKMLLTNQSPDITEQPAEAEPEQDPLELFCTPGITLEFTQEEAEQLGAFEETALGPDFDESELLAA